MTDLPVTLEIHCGTCRILVHGSRSRKGWHIFRADGHSGEDRLAHVPHKDKAIRLARDCCEPDVVGAVFLVRPATS
jgi:hypothetical protein